jgi:hypothetical protein
MVATTSAASVRAKWRVMVRRSPRA